MRDKVYFSYQETGTGRQKGKITERKKDRQTDRQTGRQNEGKRREGRIK